MDRSALTRATDPSSAPTPGYLYNDIAKSLTSPQACADTLSFLLSRLSKSNPHVKRKSLKVLSKVSCHPASRGMMKRTVVQNTSAIESMQGIGNPMFASGGGAPPPVGGGGALGTFGEIASNVGGAMLEMIKDPLARNVDLSTIGGGVGGGGSHRHHHHHQRGGYDPSARPDPYAQSQPPGRNNLALQTGGQWTMASNRGPNAVGGGMASAPLPPAPSNHHDSEYYKARNAQGGQAFSWAAAGGGGASPGDAVPPPPAAPSGDKLDEFARAVPSLNPDIVCPALLDALEEGNPWIMRAKALCVIETVLRVEAERVMVVGGGDTPYTDFFHACSAEIVPLADHSRVSVKAPAKRVLMALGVDGTTMNGSPANVTAVAQAPIAPPPNLLDFDGPSALDEVTTAAAPVPSAADQDDLLGGMGAEASVSATGSFNDMFGSMSVKSAEAKVDTVTLNASNSAPVPAVSPTTPSTKLFDPLLGMGMPMSMPMPNGNISNYTSNNTFIAPNSNIAQMQLAYQQNMIMMQQMQMRQQANSGVLQGTQLAIPTMSPLQTSSKPIMGANYMRQVPGVSGEKMSPFSFLGQDPKKKENKSFDFVMDAMNSEKK
ncbi:hypothetical protein ACHAW5_005111 [Stephanodiscus triporus]|uniref:ENTH domain-containing protein n=1 Tax=Stephanodiscus triporus TaxID=2934178 RepID=A0ABD3MKI7_9STRA